MIEIGDHKIQFNSLYTSKISHWWLNYMWYGWTKSYFWNSFSLQFKCVEHIHSCKEYVGLVKLSLKVGKWKLVFLCTLSGCIKNCFERTTLVFNISDIEDLNGSSVPTIKRKEEKKQKKICRVHLYLFPFDFPFNYIAN